MVGALPRGGVHASDALARLCDDAGLFALLLVALAKQVPSVVQCVPMCGYFGDCDGASWAHHAWLC